MMNRSETFEAPVPGLFSSHYIAQVVSVDDPENLSRVQVRLVNFDGPDEQDGPLWARVAAPFAGAGRGAFLLPDVGDEVLVVFVNGDSRFPVVVGGMWSGNAEAPESLGGAGDRVDRWTIVGKAGTRVAIIEENPGEAVIKLTTPGGVRGELTDSAGGRVEFEVSGTTITADPNGVSITTGGKVTVQASQVEVTAGQVSVNAAMSTFSGIVKCDVMQATTVVAATYTPGAGNVW